MNRELTCYVVRDLLPAYIENLTGEETAADIRAHLDGCPDCSAVYAAMTADEPAPGAAGTASEGDSASEQRSRDIDYLKKIRTGTRRRILAAVLAAFVILAVPLVRYCVIGTPDPAVAYALAMNDKATELTVEGTALGSSESLAHLSLTQDENGVVTIAPRSTHKFFYRNTKNTAALSTDTPITKVQDVFGTVYWENGETISGLGRYLFTAEIPYVGDASAVMDLLYALDLQNQLCLPDMHIELETAKEPYGMTIYTESPQLTTPAFGTGKASSKEAAEDTTATEDNVMESLFNKYACILLAKVGNLDHVSLKYITKDGETRTFTMTAEEATALTGRPIKEWADSYADIEKLLDTVGITAR